MTKEERREYERKWYKSPEGRKKRQAANKKWQKKRLDAFKELKSTLKCSRCPETHLSCLDFHHVDPSTKEVSVGEVAGRWSMNKLQKEISKCIILCANCHRKEHYKE